MNRFSITCWSVVWAIGLVVMTIQTSATATTIRLQSNTPSQAPFDSPTTWVNRRFELKQDFNTKLESLLKTNSTDKTALNSIRPWIETLDPHRQSIYLPQSKFLTSDSSDASKKTWQENFISIRREHAKKLFELAKESNVQSPAITYQLINETATVDPDHVEARRILGHRKLEDRWRVASGRLRPKLGTQAFKILDWKPRSYRIVRSDHFEIYSKASEAETVRLARLLENWHRCWRQVFFEFWGRASLLERWLDGKSQQRPSSRKFKVVFFASQQQYIDELEPLVPGIGVSLGYYDDQSKLSFFFAGDQETEDTWRHEATHQWFSESIRSRKSPFDNGNIWLGEGIAMYFESLRNSGPYFTLGGLDARRLQYARIRKLRDQFYIPFQKLHALGRVSLQRQAQIKKIYSQSAGLTHMLMNSETSEYQSNLIEYIKLLYQGKLKPGTFEKITGLSPEQVDQNYQRFVRLTGRPRQTLGRSRANRVGVSVPGTE